MIETLFIWALFSACITLLIDYCIEPGEIFGFYRTWLYRYDEKKWSKPLGLCPVCMGVWVGIAVYLVLLISSALSIWLFLPFISVNIVILRIIIKIID